MKYFNLSASGAKQIESQPKQFSFIIAAVCSISYKGSYSVNLKGWVSVWSRAFGLAICHSREKLQISITKDPLMSIGLLMGIKN